MLHYFIIGCLVLIIIINLLSIKCNSTIEGFTHNIIKEKYDIKLNCCSSWTPTYTKSAFFFSNKYYNPIYMLHSNIDDITQLFNDSRDIQFNIDCSNVVYTTIHKHRKPRSFFKYMYNNSAIEYNPFLIPETSSYVGTIYHCFKKFVNDTKPTIYFNYDSKNANDTNLILTIQNEKNKINKNIFKINLSKDGKKIVDNKLIENLSKSHPVYSSSNNISGFGLAILPNTNAKKCNIMVYKTTGINDSLTNQNIPNITTLISDINNYVLSMYNVSNGYKSKVSKYNLITKSSKIRYMYGTIESGDNQDYVIVQIPDFTS